MSCCTTVRVTCAAANSSWACLKITGGAHFGGTGWIAYEYLAVVPMQTSRADGALDSLRGLCHELPESQAAPGFDLRRSSGPHRLANSRQSTGAGSGVSKPTTQALL